MTHSAGEADEQRTRLRDGDEQVLADLFARNRARLWRLVHFRLDNRLSGRVDADDVLQEAYLAAAQRMKHYDADVSPFVWLRLIAAQTLVDVHRRHLGTQKRDAHREVSIHGKRYPQATSVSLAGHLLAHMTSPSQAAIRVELSHQLDEALEGMAPIDREVLVLRHFEELANHEVAEVLGIEQKAASIRYVRALARLRDVLEKIPGFSHEL